MIDVIRVSISSARGERLETIPMSRMWSRVIRPAKRRRLLRVGHTKGSNLLAADLDSRAEPNRAAHLAPALASNEIAPDVNRPLLSGRRLIYSYNRAPDRRREGVLLARPRLGAARRWTAAELHFHTQKAGWPTVTNQFAGLERRPRPTIGSPSPPLDADRDNKPRAIHLMKQDDCHLLWAVGSSPDNNRVEWICSA